MKPQIAQRALVIALASLFADHPSTLNLAAASAATAAPAKPTPAAAAKPAPAPAAAPAATNNAADNATAKAADTAYPLPAPYQSLIQSLQTMSTNGTSALKTFRGYERTLPIREALSKTILAYSAGPIVIDKDSTNTDIGEGKNSLCASGKLHRGSKLNKLLVCT